MPAKRDLLLPRPQGANVNRATAGVNPLFDRQRDVGSPPALQLHRCNPLATPPPNARSDLSSTAGYVQPGAERLRKTPERGR